LLPVKYPCHAVVYILEMWYGTSLRCPVEHQYRTSLRCDLIICSVQMGGFSHLKLTEFQVFCMFDQDAMTVSYNDVHPCVPYILAVTVWCHIAHQRCAVLYIVPYRTSSCTTVHYRCMVSPRTSPRCCIVHRLYTVLYIVILAVVCELSSPCGDRHHSGYLHTCSVQM
jgi:hypothetical protein